MTHRIPLLILLLISINSYSQELKNIKPIIGKTISYTDKEQAEWTRALDLLYKTDNGDIDYEQLSEKYRKLIDKLEMLEGPMTVGSACSWYCGGGPYKILASSTLDSTKETNYKAGNVHDFNILSAWIEGKSDDGIGEFIEFHFEANSPRVNKLIIYNGYFKTKELWEANSRVKKLKLFINNVPYATLDLADINAPQSFSIDPTPVFKDKELILKLQIMDIYKGSKYSDVAISEINFDGLDVHCLGKGTKILVNNNRQKNIELLNVGDTVMTYEFNKPGFSIGIVEGIEKVKHDNLVKYIFESGENIVATRDHPFMTINKGWSSLKPEKSKLYKGYEQVTQIETGDLFRVIGPDGKLSSTKLIKIEYLKEPQVTYTISTLSHGNNFIANGFIVGTEQLIK